MEIFFQLFLDPVQAISVLTSGKGLLGVLTSSSVAVKKTIVICMMTHQMKMFACFGWLVHCFTGKSGSHPGFENEQSIPKLDDGDWPFLIKRQQAYEETLRLKEEEVDRQAPDRVESRRETLSFYRGFAWGGPTSMRRALGRIHSDKDMELERLLTIAARASGRIISVESRGWLVMLLCWCICAWILLAYGVLIYTNMGPGAEREFIEMWGWTFLWDLIGVESIKMVLRKAFFMWAVTKFSKTFKPRASALVWYETYLEHASGLFRSTLDEGEGDGEGDDGADDGDGGGGDDDM
mmetsp:Transcript_9877/g.32352  ORF Transcript_9877/g.32352 Transcript_9877/m.32352 type:complete len:294 (-) Transcript_9877:127-1008(-)